MVTYNCLSLQSPLQREMLDEQFSQHRADVVFIQEARREACNRFHSQHFFGASSAAEQGRFGCQIWFRQSSCPGPGSGDRWIPSTLSVLHSSPRALLVTCCAGNERFALLSAHGPTAKASEAAIDDWWRDIRAILKKVPSRCILCVGCDANARFEHGIRYPDADYALGPAGRHLCDLMVQQSLCSNSLFDCPGEAVCTWTSPSGQRACIDYTLVPRELQDGFRTVGKLQGFVDLYDFDHQPLVTELAWSKKVPVHQSIERIHARAIDTPEGRRKLEQIYLQAPIVDWDVDVDTHLLTVNRYLHGALTACFPACLQQPRKSHFSAATWATVCLRRNQKRVGFRADRLRWRLILDACFCAWRKGSIDGSRVAKRLHSLDHLVARSQNAVQKLTGQLRRSVKTDVAREARIRFYEAKNAGPEQLAGHFRGILKTGRRYRPPAIRPTLASADRAFEEDSLAVLGRHFARAERGKPCEDVSALQCTAQNWKGVVIRREDLPDIPELIRGFARLSKRKAAGISRIPAEAFLCSPVGAAELHFPLLLKAYSCQQFPLGWRGGEVAAISKPKKSLSCPSGWRSIMLLESSMKGIGKAVRATLLEGYDRVCFSEQGGSRPRVTLQMPMMYVQEFVRRLQNKRRSGGFIFIDGRNAFYSTLRELLFDVPGTAEDGLRRMVDMLSPDEKERDRLMADLLGPGLLRQSGVPEPLCQMLRASMNSTWFSLDSRVYSTTTGTMPGAPLADLLFQFVFTRFISRVKQEVAEHALGNDVFEDGSLTELLPLPSWMDDIALPLLVQEPAALVTTAQKLVEATARHLHDIGISINTDRGKTEAMLCFQGTGSRRVRHHHLVECRSRFAVRLPTGESADIHITPTYVHLGASVTWNGSPIPDIQRRAGMAWEAVPGVRRHILANPGLRWTEKMHMYSSLILGRFLHGAGLWVLTTKDRFRAYSAAYMGFLRKACWPVLGCSSQSLTDEQVCAALGQFDASTQRRFDVLGQLVWIARHHCPFFRRLLVEGEWIQYAIQAWHQAPALALDLAQDAALFLQKTLSPARANCQRRPKPQRGLPKAVSASAATGCSAR